MKTDFQEIYDPLALGLVAFLIILLITVFGIIIWSHFKNRKKEGDDNAKS